MDTNPRIRDSCKFVSHLSKFVYFRAKREESKSEGEINKSLLLFMTTETFVFPSERENVGLKPFILNIKLSINELTMVVRKVIIK